MNDQTTQPAATPDNAAPQAPAADQGARIDPTADLATFLSDYETVNAAPAPSPTPAPQPAPGTDPLVATLLSKVESWERREAEAKNDAETNKAVVEIKGDYDGPDYDVKGWLIDYANKNPTINKVWDNTASRPALLSKLKAAWTAERAIRAKAKTDPDATANREAVTAAVRGASGRAPDDAPKNYGRMSDHDLRQELQKMGITPTF